LIWTYHKYKHYHYYYYDYYCSYYSLIIVPLFVSSLFFSHRYRLKHPKILRPHIFLKCIFFFFFSNDSNNRNNNTCKSWCR
jgi:hypothetical protein